MALIRDDLNRPTPEPQPEPDTFEVERDDSGKAEKLSPVDETACDCQDGPCGFRHYARRVKVTLKPPKGDPQ